MPSAKGQTEDENFQRLDRQNKYLQRRMNAKNYFCVKIFRRRRNDGVEDGLYTHKLPDLRKGRAEQGEGRAGGEQSGGRAERGEESRAGVFCSGPKLKRVPQREEEP